jgi:hypothetical protein
MPILVLDTEGADSYERYSSNSWDIEGQVGLLAVSISNVIIISLYFSEVGRNNASNLPLLDRIIAVYLKMNLSYKTKRPVLLFVIRDYSLEMHGALSDIKLFLECTLESALAAHQSKKSRAAIQIPSIDSLFQIELVGLPHYLMDSEDYKQKFFESVNLLSPRYDYPVLATYLL